MSNAKRSDQLRVGFKEIEKTWVWGQLRAELEARLLTAQAAVESKANGPEPDLRVSAAMQAAFRTALNLPQIMIAEATTQEEIERQNGDIENDQDRA